MAIGVFGTLAHRGFGRVPFNVPAWPWYHSDPFYLFWDPRWPSAWVAVALAAATGVVAVFRSQARTGVRVAASAGLLLVLALAVAALDGGSAAWRAPLAFTGEYPHGVEQVGDLPSFLRQFPERLASLPSHASGHPAGAMVLYALLARSGPGWRAALAVHRMSGGAAGRGTDPTRWRGGSVGVAWGAVADNGATPRTRRRGSRSRWTGPRGPHTGGGCAALGRTISGGALLWIGYC